MGMTKISSALASVTDAPALVAVWNRLYPEQPVSEDAFSFAENRYLLARAGEDAVGYLEVSRSRREGDPEGKLWAYMTFSPSSERESPDYKSPNEKNSGQDEAAVVRALYEGLEALPDVCVLYTMAHETQTVRQKILEELGYSEILRSYGADLEVAAVDLKAFGDPETELRAQGVVIYTLAELTPDPGFLDKLYTLYLESNRDVPEVGHSDTLSRADFEAHLKRDDALPEAYHVAVKDDHYLGYSELFAGRKAGTLRQETTAVLRAYRRRGVALALKLRGLAYARAHGYTHVDTGMASNNAAVVALNTRLGFVPQQAYLTFGKDV